jgi:hypothetical protein
VDHLRENDSGNDAINKDVLREFRKLTEGIAVWERGEKRRRKREPGDDPGRMQRDC